MNSVYHRLQDFLAMKIVFLGTLCWLCWPILLDYSGLLSWDKALFIFIANLGYTAWLTLKPSL